jgi:hypothetical protein
MVAGIHNPVVIAVDAETCLLLVPPFGGTPRALILVLPIAGYVNKILFAAHGDYSPSSALVSKIP